MAQNNYGLFDETHKEDLEKEELTFKESKFYLRKEKVFVSKRF